MVLRGGERNEVMVLGLEARLMAWSRAVGVFLVVASMRRYCTVRVAGRRRRGVARSELMRALARQRPATTVLCTCAMVMMVCWSTAMWHLMWGCVCWCRAPCDVSVQCPWPRQPMKQHREQ